jgi:hypothetical protein
MSMLEQAFIPSHVEAVMQTKPALSATPNGTTKLCVFENEGPRSSNVLLRDEELHPATENENNIAVL